MGHFSLKNDSTKHFQGNAIDSGQFCRWRIEDEGGLTIWRFVEIKAYDFFKASTEVEQIFYVCSLLLEIKWSPLPYWSAKQLDKFLKKI